MKKLKTFKCFPPDSVCPVCGGSEDAPCVLVKIDGTSDGSICEALLVHLNCAVATNFNKNLGVMYLRTEQTEVPADR